MREIQNRLRIISLLCMALAVSGVAWAQSSYTAAMRGVVTDASGGAIPGATVTLTESDRNIPHTVITDEAGRYVITALPPGRYTFSAELTGFKTYTQSNIPLAVQQQATFDQFIRIYNEERPHQAIGMRYPCELYEPSPRPYSGLSELHVKSQI